MGSIERVNHISLLIITFIAVTFSLHFTKDVLLPLVFGVVIFEALLPIVHFLDKKTKLPRSVNSLIAFLVFLLVLVVLVLFLIHSVSDFLNLGEIYKYKFQQWGAELSALAAKNGLNEQRLDPFQVLRDIPVISTIRSFAGNFLGFVGQFSLVALIVGFLLFGSSQKGLAENHFFSKVNKKISKYLATKFISSFATAVIIGVILWSFNSDMVLVFAFLAFILNFIPTIGSFISLLLPLPVLALKIGFGLPFIACFVLMGCTHILIGNVIEPKFMGQSLALHPVTILISLLFWGVVWGIPGMFLSVPITASLKIILERMEATQSFALLLEGKIAE